MDALIRKAQAAQRLTDRFIGIAMFSREDVKEFMIELNTVGQLFDKGQDSVGNLLPTYSKTTELITGGKKKAGQPFTLFDTGEFYGSFTVIVDGNGDADIEANTIKVDDGQLTDLLDIATPFIIGLSNESKDKLSQFLIPIIQQIVRQTLVNT